jgi:hypothetical protein
MNIDIYGLKEITFDKQAATAERGVALNEYLKDNLNKKLFLLEESLQIALNRTTGSTLFFTLPEFYWNIPWGYIYSEEELAIHFDFYFDKLTNLLNDLIDRLVNPRNKRIILIAGTVEILFKLDSNLEDYEALNYCLVVSNAKDKTGRNQISMWPKRYVSKIDIGQKYDEDDDYFYFNLSDNLNIKVVKKGSSSSEHNNEYKVGSQFDNTWIEGLPFSINICVDYRELSTGERNKELLSVASKLDFLIACGMPFSDTHVYPNTVMYAYRNDGYPSIAGIEVSTVRNGKLDKNIETIEVSSNLYHCTLEF